MRPTSRSVWSTPPAPSRSAWSRPRRRRWTADVRRARDELRREVADLATAVAEKLVRRSLRDDDHRRIVADAIAKVGN